jgi:beta-lactamase regulating signal transducer with metallopeptidase domain
MNAIHLQSRLLDHATHVAEFGLNWFVQSSLLIGLGLVVAWLLRSRGSAAQSAIYRTTLAAVLVCPLLTYVLSIVGVSGFSVQLPRTRAVLETAPEDNLLLPGSDHAEVAFPVVRTPDRSPASEREQLVADEDLSAGPATVMTKAALPAPLPIRSDGAMPTVSPHEQPTSVANRVGLTAAALCLTWLVVAAALLARLAGAWRQLSKIRHSAGNADTATVETCRQVATLLKVAVPEVMHSPYLPSPCLAGLRRPIVLLPEAFQTMSVRNVLIHELAHLRRRDCHWSLLVRMATAVFFFQPLLWRLSRRLDVTAEEVCDDHVMQLGGNRKNYARRLVEIAELSSTPVAAAAVGIVSIKSTLARRVARITETSRNLSTRVGKLLLTLVLAGGLITTTAAGLVGLETQADEENVDKNESPAKKDAGAPEKEGNRDKVVVRGKVVDSDGEPVAGSHVAAIAQKMGPHHTDRSASASKTFAEATTDESGHFKMSFPRLASQGTGLAKVVTRMDGAGVAWQPLNLDAPELDAPFTLPREGLARGKLVDAEGRPASQVKLSIRSVMPREESGTLDIKLWAAFDRPPAAWPPAVVTDSLGRFTIHGVPAGHGVGLRIIGDDRFAPQDLLLNSGLPEQRGDRDGTYRSQIKNTDISKEAVFTPAPARFFEGVVRYADTGDPVPHAQVSAWASQQEKGGSMSSVHGKADANGRYRICPKSGVRFGLMAYPPSGRPYLIREIRDLRFADGETTKTVGLTLPRGVLAQGTIVGSATDTPIEGAAVQYVPERKNNPHVRSEIVTGWQGIQLSDEQGRYTIAVLPGPGRLIIHGPTNDYVVQESSSRRLDRGTTGGPRVYAHCIEKIEPEVNADALELNLSLDPSPAMTGELVDEQGVPITEATTISRLIIHPYWLEWGAYQEPDLGALFRIAGLPPGKECPVHFLDAKRRLGATVPFQAGADRGRVVLEPCGQATMRFVDSEGQPVADFRPAVQIIVTPGVNQWGSFDWMSWNLGMPMADADYISNTDRVNYSPFPRSDEDGRLTLPALIPGATYGVIITRSETVKTFKAKANESVDLGDLVVERTKNE